MKVMILVLLLLPWKHAAAQQDTEQENTTIESPPTTIRRLRKKRHLGQQHFSSIDELPLNSLSFQRIQQQLNNYDEFDLNRFLENDTSFSVPTMAPTKSKPITTPPVTVLPTVVPSSMSPTPSVTLTPIPIEVSLTHRIRILRHNCNNGNCANCAKTR
jgi:hypothetical protein